MFFLIVCLFEYSRGNIVIHYFTIYYDYLRKTTRLTRDDLCGGDGSVESVRA